MGKTQIEGAVPAPVLGRPRDLNGDGAIDVAPASFLLLLFAGGGCSMAKRTGLACRAVPKSG